MTIRIKITNEDSRQTAVVKVRELNRQTMLSDKSLMPIVRDAAPPLKGGESVDLYVHDGQSLLIEESQNG